MSKQHIGVGEMYIGVPSKYTWTIPTLYMMMWHESDFILGEIIGMSARVCGEEHPRVTHSLRKLIADVLSTMVRTQEQYSTFITNLGNVEEHEDWADYQALKARLSQEGKVITPVDPPAATGDEYTVEVSCVVDGVTYG